MSMGSTQPFRASGTAQLAAGTSSGNVRLVGGGEAVLVYNATATVAFVRFGTDATLVATVSDTPVPPSGRMLLHAGGPFVTTAAAVLGGGSGSVFFTRGEGTVY